MHFWIGVKYLTQWIQMQRKKSMSLDSQDAREEHAFRHCAVITQLYSTYETSAEMKF